MHETHANAWAFVYVALVVSMVFATIALFTVRSDASGSVSTMSSQAARNVPGLSTVRTLRAGRYELQIQSLPRRLGQPALASIRILRGTHAVDGATVRLTFSMPDMPDMRGLTTRLRQTAPGIYVHAAPILTVGRWLARFQITPAHAPGFEAKFTYRVSA